MEFSGFNNSNLTFNDSASLPRESLDQTYGRNNAYATVFDQHPEGHHVLAQDPKVSHHHAHEYFKIGANQLIDATEEVSESLAQHKYSQLANGSYTYYNSKGDANAVHEGLGDPDFSYIEDLGGFNVDSSLSTKDNLVLHNEITGETHVAYRGTTDKMSSQFFEDWKVNGEIAGGSTHTTRVQEAESQFEQVVSKYGKNNLTVSGHSQGGHVSYEMGVRNDVRGFHYNPAINSTQVTEAGRYAGNVSEQAVFKQPLDFASPLAYHKNLAKSKTKLNIVQNLHGKDSVIDTHSIDNFAPTPKEVVGDVVKAERRTLAGSVVKGAGHIVGVGMSAYSFAEDVKKDKTVSDVAVDAGKQVEEYVVDGEILTAGLALAPETMGLSVVASLGAVIINDLVAEHTADYIKEEIPKVGETLKNTGKKVGRWFKNLF
tara:strand:- start:619 stop:1905 length:1287 start_codon:yes stop_codon:yes gene_type:complete